MPPQIALQTLLLMVALLGWIQCRPAEKRSEKNSNLPAAKQSSFNTNQKIRQISAGDHSAIVEPFIFVARDAGTYAMLREAVSDLPEQDDDSFDSNAVIAVFLGQRPTGGFGIDITSEADGALHVNERRPRKGAMLKTVLTAPYKIVAVAVGANEPLHLLLDQTWKAKLRTYRLTTGEVTITGGIAGKRENLKLQGRIELIPMGSLGTFIFDIQSRAGNTHRLFDVASGRVDPLNKITLNRLDAFGLTGAIQSPFRAVGEFTNQEQNLSLRLKTIPAARVSDNFTASGSIRATSISSPRNSASRSK